jgi:hypothetical protein
MSNEIADQMSFNLVKAIKNTHRNPINIILHVVGLVLYCIGLYLIADDLIGEGQKMLLGIFSFIAAIGLFLIGHKIEGNIRAITIFILLKYIKSKI